MSESTFTDRVAFCVVKANCRGPSFLTHTRAGVDGKSDRWECRHCYGWIHSPRGTMPQKDERSEYENTRQ